MNISGIQYGQGVSRVSIDHTNSASNKGLTVGQTNESDTVGLSKEARELYQKYESNDLDDALALFKEVGFEKYQIIMKTVKQIEKALLRTADDFPSCKKALEKIKTSFSQKLPRSVSEAMSRLSEALEDFPEEVRESVLRHLEDEKKKDNVFSGVDSGLLFTAG